MEKNMISQKTQLETKVSEKDHTYHCPANAVLDECLEALNVFISYVYGRKKMNEEAAAAQAAAQAVPMAPGQTTLPVTDEVKTQ
jgi:hypothetical protein